MPARIDLTGRKFGRFTVVAYDRSDDKKVWWRCVCECGVSKSVRAGDLLSGKSKSCGCYHRDRRKRQHDVAPSYVLAHRRVGQRHGPAKTHKCIDCGRQALEWSYDGLDPDERIETSGLSRGLRYSIRIEHYQARCRSCHRKHDFVDGKRRKRAEVAA